jgi:GT2 family glycosyltransferase
MVSRMQAQSNLPATPVTVAIATADRPAVLGRCLDTLLAGEALPSEIVIVDQSRDERTRALVAARTAGSPPIVYLRHPGRGLGVAQNLAFRRARASVVAVTDDDCVPAPDWLAMIARAFAAGGIDLLTGRVLALGPAIPGRYPVSTREGTEARQFAPGAMPWLIGSGNNFAARRDWLLRIGGNNERLGPGAPGRGGVDMDLFYRLLRAGARVRYDPGVLVYHERTDRAGRRSRRGPYGYGMGACCAIWWRAGDPGAPAALARWLSMRTWRMLGAARRGQWELVREEGLVLRGTFGGIRYGLRAWGKTEASQKGDQDGF